jgi:hypothetical protein
MKEDDFAGRKTPPETPEEWAYVWRGVQRGHSSWVIAKPVYAFVTNWKALAAGLIFLVWINRPEVIAALSMLIGGGE